jgi:hypothetical protein
MTTRNDFSPDEWAAITRTALAPAFMMAVTVDFNLFALSRKLEALWAAIEFSRRRSSTWLMNDLLKQVDMQRQGGEGEPNMSSTGDLTADGNLRSGLPGMLHEALEILASKADREEIAEYRAFILDTTEAVTQASHAKGIFANQGDLVSEDETKFMNIIRTALRR